MRKSAKIGNKLTFDIGTFIYQQNYSRKSVSQMNNGWQLNETDLKIVRVLIDNPREKIGAIAKDLGISATAVAKRIEVLKKNGLITGTCLMVEPEARALLGFSVTAVLVSNTKYSCRSEIIQAIRRHAIEMDGLVLTTCQSGIGHYDILVGIFAKDKFALDEMRRFVEGLPGVKKTALYPWLDIDLGTEWGKILSARR
jgi:DNA-binding Lrp family transcriptional regulator